MSLQLSLLPLTNGARVLAVDARVRGDGVAEGVVLAITTDDQYVTWRVYRQRGEDERWLASHGDYDIPQDLAGAIEAYEKRRAE